MEQAMPGLFKTASVLSAHVALAAAATLFMAVLLPLALLATLAAGAPLRRA
jgi:hypothetical protein